MYTVRSFKDVCFKLGFVMTIFFISGSVCTILVNYIHYNIADVIGVTANYITRLSLSAVFIYGIPIIAAVTIFKEDGGFSFASLYKKPARLSKAIGNFPAMYGLGQITNFITLFVIWLISNLQSRQLETETLERSFGTMESLFPPNITCGIALAVYMTFGAALFEEFLCRGVLLNALKPYGNGFAIIITGFLFGIMHGNFQQFTYAFVLGIVLAYITLQTGSILSATILHAMFNSVSAVLMLFLSTETVQQRLFLISPETVTEENTALVAGFGIFFALVIGLLIAGIALAVRKLLQLKKYVNTSLLKSENVFSQAVSVKSKYAMFLTSVPVIIMLLLTVDAFAGRVVAGKIFEWLWS